MVPNATVSSKKSSSSLDNYEHLLLALVVLVPYVLFVAYVVFKAPPAPTLETLAATYGGLAAAVVGYYFGQTPVQAALNKAQEASAQQQKLKSNTVDILSELSSIEQQLQSHKSTIEELHHRNESLQKEIRIADFTKSQNLVELTEPKVLESQRSRVSNNVEQIDNAVKKIDEIRRNSMQLLA